MLAYHDNPQIKTDILSQLAKHREADRLAQNYGYWEHGRGCAVGCTLHSGEHSEYETRFGIPEALAHLEDLLFEKLPVDLAREWPERFMGAVPVGADLALVHYKFMIWVLSTYGFDGIEHRKVRSYIFDCLDVLKRRADGELSEPAIWSDVSSSESWLAIAAEDSQDDENPRAAKNCARRFFPLGDCDHDWIAAAGKLIELIEATGD